MSMDFVSRRDRRSKQQLGQSKQQLGRLLVRLPIDLPWWKENKLSRCDALLLLWLDSKRKRMRGQIRRISNFKTLSVAGEKTWARCLVIKDRPRQKSHRFIPPG